VEFDKKTDVAFPPWTHSGLFAVVDYMQAFRRIIFDLNQTFPNMSEELADYLRLLKETQQWRLNFGYPRLRERFVQVGRVAAQKYIEYIPKEEGVDSQSAIDEFVKNLLELMTDWGAPVVRAAGA